MEIIGAGTMQITAMDRAYIDEYDVVQRYIRRTLTASELAGFEIYMLSNTSIIDEIEQQKMLNQIFREELPKAKVAAISRNPLLRFRHAVPLAACLALAMYVGINTVGTDSSGVDSSARLTTLNTVVLQDLRGASSTFNAELPQNITGDAVNVPLKIDVGPQLEPVVTYSLFVRSNDGKTVVAEQQNQRASADGWLELTVALPASAAAYQVEVVEFPRGDNRNYSLSLQ